MPLTHCEKSTVFYSATELGSTIPGNFPEITAEEVEAAQTDWKNGIIEIGALFLERGDYQSRAKRLVSELYNYENGPVLFKPTMATEFAFRLNSDDALSYFIGGGFAEDLGFALAPWKKIDFRNAGISVYNGIALVMGNYFLEDFRGNIAKVEYTFAYTRCSDGKLRIIAHHSSFPYGMTR